MTKSVGGVDTDRLQSIVERIEHLEEEKRNLSSDIKDIYSEAKSAGYDVPALKALIKLRKTEPAKREELESMLDLYRHALGV